jgi:hypothetical protein
MEWVAYCITCSKELERCPNGNFAEAAARHHRRTNWGHFIIIGYEYEPPGFNEPMKLSMNTPKHY